MWAQRQHRTGHHHGPRWHCWLLTSGCSSPPSSLQFSLSSLCPHPFVLLSLPFLHHLLDPLSGKRDLSVWGGLTVSLKSGIPCLCFMGLDRDPLRHGLLPMFLAHLHSAAWWPSLANSMSRPHGGCLGLTLAPAWASSPPGPASPL